MVMDVAPGFFLRLSVHLFGDDDVEGFTPLAYELCEAVKGGADRVVGYITGWHINVDEANSGLGCGVLLGADSLCGELANSVDFLSRRVPWSIDGDMLYLSNLYVLPSHRGIGLGRATLAAFIGRYGEGASVSGLVGAILSHPEYLGFFDDLVDKTEGDRIARDFWFERMGLEKIQDDGDGLKGSGDCYFFVHDSEVLKEQLMLERV